MAVPSNDQSGRLIAYFHDCLEGEFAHHDTVDNFRRGSRHLLTASLDPGHGHHRFPEKNAHFCQLCIGDFSTSDEMEEIAIRYQMLRQDYQLVACLGTYKSYYESLGRRLVRNDPLFIGSIDELPTCSDELMALKIDNLVLNPDLVSRYPALEDLPLPNSPVRWQDLSTELSSRYGLEVAANDKGVPLELLLRRRSQLSSSVMHELSEMSKPSIPLSGPVAQIIGLDPATGQDDANSAPELLPSSLTRSQEQAVLNGARRPLSVINGPPGTGKTHTIACQVLDAVINQRSTLVVCSNDQSADVVRDKIAAMLEGAEHIILRPGRGNYQQDLVDQINQWLEGEQEPPEDEAALARTTERLERTSQRFRHAEASFFRAVADAERSTEGGAGPGAWFRRWWSALRTWRSPLLTKRWQELQVSISDHQACMHDYLLQQLDARLSGLLANHRDALATLSMALRSRASHRRNERFEALDWSTLTRVFPVWIVSAGDLSDSVPMTTELFDLVIVDEATQCNLPQALPALQRGKRAVIVGDPRQLRHYSFLARKVQEEAALRHDLKAATLDLDYRSRSLLDYAIDALPHRNALSFLDEHFRSNPMLIDFSNQHFYQQRIRILTTHRQNQPDQPLQAVACPVQEKDNINLAEVEQVLETLHTLINQYRDSSSPPGIGVLGMVRATALMLEDRITREISLEDISRHQLRVGTPYAFQGDERDIMLVASCAWPGQVHGTQRYLERDDVFNVAVTRARQRQVFFHGDGLVEAEPERLASRYVRHGQQSRQDRDHRESTSEAGDPVLQELSSWFAARGLRARPNLPFAGQLVELTVEVDQQLVAIDLVGRRDARCDVGKAWDPARYRLLERAGLVLTPIARRHWLNRRGEVMADLERQLSIGDHHAPLNQPLKSPLYRRLRELGPVGGADGPSPAELFDQLHKAGNLVEFWLKQQFSPEELTYQRYNQTRISLLVQAERKLEGICLILESFRGLGAPEDLQDMIARRVAECRPAVDSLVNLARELAELGATDMTSTMDELQRLTDRVSDYRLN